MNEACNTTYVLYMGLCEHSFLLSVLRGNMEEMITKSILSTSGYGPQTNKNSSKMILPTGMTPIIQKD